MMFRRRNHSPLGNSRRGYIFLVLVLLAGALASLAIVSLLLLSWSQEQQASRQQNSSQALELARSCMDVAMLQLRQEPSGNIDTTNIQLPNGACTILAALGGGADKRKICTQATMGNVTRYLTATFTARFPLPLVSDYQEILDTKDCSVLP